MYPVSRFVASVLRITYYVLRVTHYVLRVTCYVLRVTCYVLPVIPHFLCVPYAYVATTEPPAFSSSIASPQLFQMGLRLLNV
jgi:hypothetical protein